MPWLKGKRILVVEDEALIAVMVEDMLSEMGSIVVGPAATIEQALALARAEEIDGAVLDVNVRGERIDPVADALAGIAAANPEARVLICGSLYLAGSILRENG